MAKRKTVDWKVVERPSKTKGVRCQARRYGAGAIPDAGPIFDTREEAEAWIEKDKLHVAGLQRDVVDLRAAPSLAGDFPLDAYIKRFGKVILDKTNNGEPLADSKGQWANWDKRIRPAFGHQSLNELSKLDVLTWIEDMEMGAPHLLGDRDEVGASTRRQSFVTLQKIYTYAIEHDHTTQNPTLGLAKRVGRTQPQVMRSDVPEPMEVIALSEAVSPRYRLLILILGFGGLRISEALALGFQDLERHEIGWTIDVHKQLGRRGKGIVPTKTKHGNRVVAVNSNPHFETAVREHFEQFGRTKPMFLNEDGNPLLYENFKDRHFKKAMKALKLDNTFTIHSLRHTAVSLWVDAAVYSETEIASFAGHHSGSYTLDVYSHLFKRNRNKLDPRRDEAYARTLARHGIGVD